MRRTLLGHALTGLCLLTLSLSAAPALAQSLEDEQASTMASQLGDDETPPSPASRLGDEQASAEETAPAESPRDSLDPHEEPNVDYFFLGAFYRHMFIPGFIQELFMDGGGVEGSNPAFGLEFTWRKNNFSLVGNFWWANAQGQGFGRGNNANVTETERITANMGVIFLSAAFLWGFPIVDWFSIELGFDFGIGFIYGSLNRNEARPDPSAPGGYVACSGPGDPANPSYCETVGGHYNYNEPNWFGGGDVPFLFPWIAAPHLAVRFNPIHQLQIRIDGGYNIYGFNVGGSVAYGF